MAQTPRLIHIHPEAPLKPALGDGCNGCGVCCILEPCPLGQLVSRKRSGACKALRWDESQSLYRCGMVTDPDAVLGVRWKWASPVLRRLAMRWISAGSGCDAAIEAIPAQSATERD
ncbi:hypothetical protein [Hydrogenophaga sp. 5NK40-0174]|uniref:hypothetical protein n=1 Tax=Hydrogenophaga sp. 5NK40-0174 TaxID=3127649 RepID=UPI003105437B